MAKAPPDRRARTHAEICGEECARHEERTLSRIAQALHNCARGDDRGFPTTLSFPGGVLCPVVQNAVRATCVRAHAQGCEVTLRKQTKRLAALRGWPTGIADAAETLMRVRGFVSDTLCRLSYGAITEVEFGGLLDRLDAEYRAEVVASRPARAAAARDRADGADVFAAERARDLAVARRRRANAVGVATVAGEIAQAAADTAEELRCQLRAAERALTLAAELPPARAVDDDPILALCDRALQAADRLEQLTARDRLKKAHASLREEHRAAVATSRRLAAVATDARNQIRACEEGMQWEEERLARATTRAATCRACARALSRPPPAE